MRWVVLAIAIIAGLLFGTIGLKRAGFAISFGLFIWFWKLLFDTGYEMSHMSTIVVGAESAINGVSGDWFTAVLSALLFAGVCTLLPELGLRHPLEELIVSIETGSDKRKVKKTLKEAETITDRDELIRIAREDDDIGTIITDRITDEEMLFEIAKPGGRTFSRLKAIEKINDPQKIEKLIELSDSTKEQEKTKINFAAVFKERLERVKGDGFEGEL